MVGVWHPAARPRHKIATTCLKHFCGFCNKLQRSAARVHRGFAEGVHDSCSDAIIVWVAYHVGNSIFNPLLLSDVPHPELEMHFCLFRNHINCSSALYNTDVKRCTFFAAGQGLQFLNPVSHLQNGRSVARFKNIPGVDGDAFKLNMVSQPSFSL